MSVQYNTHGTSRVLIICPEFSIHIFNASYRKQSAHPHVGNHSNTSGSRGRCAYCIYFSNSVGSTRDRPPRMTTSAVSSRFIHLCNNPLAISKKPLEVLPQSNIRLLLLKLRLMLFDFRHRLTIYLRDQRSYPDLCERMRKGRHMHDSVRRRVRYLKQPGLAERSSGLQRILAASAFALWLSIAAPFESCTAPVSENQQGTAADLKQLSLGQLGDPEVTTASKEPEEVWRTVAAIYVLTQAAPTSI
jgi:hypothetical protein